MNPLDSKTTRSEGISASSNTDSDVMTANSTHVDRDDAAFKEEDTAKKEHQDAPEETTKDISNPSETPCKDQDSSSKDQESSEEEKFIEWAGKINKVLAKGVQAIVEVGQQLIAAKQDVGSRNFQKMVKQKLPFCVRQAQKYMKIAKNEVLSNANYGSLLPRQINQLYKLSRFTPAILTQILDEVKNIDIEDENLNIDSEQFWEPLIEKYRTLANKANKATQATTDQGKTSKKEAEADNKQYDKLKKQITNKWPQLTATEKKELVEWLNKKLSEQEENNPVAA